jgi:hypothetical protein
MSCSQKPYKNLLVEANMPKIYILSTALRKIVAFLNAEERGEPALFGGFPSAGDW